MPEYLHLLKKCVNSIHVSFKYCFYFINFFHEKKITFASYKSTEKKEKGSYFPNLFTHAEKKYLKHHEYHQY